MFQALLSVLIGFGAAIGLVWLMGWILPQVVPGVNIALSSQSVARVLLASLVIGVIAVLIPTRQVAQLDPAQVFRE